MTTAQGNGKRGRGRPPGSGKPTSTRIAERLDRELLAQLRGVQAFDCNGRPVVDAQGKPVLRPPSASLLSVAEKRVRAAQTAAGGGTTPDGDRGMADLMDELAAEEWACQTATPKTDAPDLPA